MVPLSTYLGRIPIRKADNVCCNQTKSSVSEWLQSIDLRSLPVFTLRVSLLKQCFNFGYLLTTSQLIVQVCNEKSGPVAFFLIKTYFFVNII